MLLLYAIAAGLIAGRLRGGRVRNLERLELAWWPLAIAGLLAQLILFARPVAEVVGQAGPWLYVVSTGLVFVVMLCNLRVPGVAVIAVGATLNLAAILANGGYMPSSPQAWLALTGSPDLPVTTYTNVALIGAGTALPFLGDVFVLPSFVPMAAPFSVGDICIAIGALILLVRAMAEPRAKGREQAPVANSTRIASASSHGSSRSIARP
jgi:hypothetical protein